MSNFAFLTLWSALTAGLVAVSGRRLWRASPPGSRIYLALSWALVAIGSIQAGVSPFRFPGFDEAALWFLMAAMAIALTGAMNLLNFGRAMNDPGVRRVCLAANLAMTAVFVLVATHRGTEPPHDPVSIALITVGGLTTLLGSAPRPAAPAGSGTGDLR